MSQTKIGFIGTGLMGSRMASNLLDSGYELIIYNRTKEKAQTLISKGAQFKDSPSKVAEKCEILFTMLADPDTVEELAVGENGFLDHMQKNSLWVDSTTVDPDFSQKMAKKAQQKNIGFLDAPVGGSTGPAEEGKLIFMVRGNEENLDKIQPLLDIMGNKTLHIGENGKGASMKMVLNLMLGQAMTAFSEAVNFGKQLKIDENIILDILLDGPVTAPYLTQKKEKIIQKDYSPQFPLKHMHKDLQLIAKTAYKNNSCLISGNAAKELFGIAKNMGLENMDFSSLYTAIEKLNENK